MKVVSTISVGMVGVDGLGGNPFYDRSQKLLLFSVYFLGKQLNIQMN